MVTGAHQLRLEITDVVEPINVAYRRPNIELSWHRTQNEYSKLQQTPVNMYTNSFSNHLSLTDLTHSIEIFMKLNLNNYPLTYSAHYISIRFVHLYLAFYVLWFLLFCSWYHI